jgi:hypothetical protein
MTKTRRGAAMPPGDPIRGLAKRKLAQARILLAQAGAVGVNAGAPYVTFLEAALAFAQSVEDHVRQEHARRRGFGGWFKTRRAAADTDGLLAYLDDERNRVMHRGPASLRRSARTPFPLSTHMRFLRMGANMPPPVTQSWHLLDPRWRDREARDVIADYCTRLEGIVREAQAAFPPDPTARSRCPEHPYDEAVCALTCGLALGAAPRTESTPPPLPS